MAEQIKFGDRLFLKGHDGSDPNQPTGKVIFDNGTADAIIESRNGNITILGNLNVQGTTTTVNTVSTEILDDHMLLTNLLDSNNTSHLVGIEVKRDIDDLTNVKFSWDDLSERWSFYDNDIHSTGDLSITNITATGNILGDIVSETGVVLIDVSGNGIVDFRGGNIDGTVIGATTSASGTFTTITGDGTNITNVLTNYTTDDLVEGTNNLYYTDLRVDERLDYLFDAGYGVSASTAGPGFEVSLDYIDVGVGLSLIDPSDINKFAIRTVSVGDSSNGGHNDLSLSISGDGTLIFDTLTPINRLQYYSTTGNGTLSNYTMPFSVNEDWHLLVNIDGVVQTPTESYTVTGNVISLANPLPTDSVLNVIKLASNNTATSTADATTLNGEFGSYYLDYNNLTNTPILFDGQYSSLIGSPTNVSEFTNDSGYITLAEIPTNHMVNDATNTVSGSINPSVDATYDLGTSTEQWNTIYGHTVEATYADLAERYSADAPYEPGTVLVFGGELEVTTTTKTADRAVAGIVSTEPAYLMNSKAGNSQTHPAIALKGRVPCKVVGVVKKGDLLVTSNVPGYAKAALDTEIEVGTVIGKAIGDKSGVTPGIVEVFVSMM